MMLEFFILGGEGWIKIINFLKKMKTNFVNMV